MTGDPAGPDIGADGLAGLVLHYAHALAVAPSVAVLRRRQECRLPLEPRRLHERSPGVI
jgi:hypothetical protein